MATKANETQVGGNHYKHDGGEEHWDRAWRLNWDPFQYQITKYVERWKDKNGVEDLKKAAHFLQKYIELLDSGAIPAKEVWWNPPAEDAKLYGPGSVSTPLMDSMVKNWTGFTYEGGSKNWDLYTCKDCRKEVYVPVGANPHEAHPCMGRQDGG